MIKLLFFIVLIHSSFFHLKGQIDYDVVKNATSTIFINDAIIQKTPTLNIGIGDIVIQNGIISNVAKSLAPPYDARIIEADSSYAYACFIDVLSHTGVGKEERNQKRPEVKFPGSPPNHVAGITPELSLSNKLSTTDPSIKAMRNAGFGISHSVPRGQMLPGQGSLITLKDGDDILVSENASIFLQFSGVRGFYPSTVIGVMAKWRDLYRKAHYLSLHQSSYNLNPLGTARPKWDKSLEALIPVTQLQTPVFHNTPGIKDVFRALELKRELGYNLVLVNVKNGWDAIESIKALNVPIALSLDLPKTEKDKNSTKGKRNPREGKSDSEKRTDKSASKNTEKSKPNKEDDPETKALKARKLESLKAYEAQASKFEKAGIPFAFSMLTAAPDDLKKNIKRMIDNGLSEQMVLEALTTNPAKILGISNVCGTIEIGKMANIFISDKSFFEDKSRMNYVIVEGMVYEIPKKEKKDETNEDQTGEDTQNLIGNWSFEVDIPDDPRTGRIIISESDKKLDIEVIDNSRPLEVNIVSDISTNGNQVSLTVNVNDNGADLPVNLSLIFEDNEFTGEVSIEGVGSFPIKGRKNDSPD